MDRVFQLYIFVSIGFFNLSYAQWNLPYLRPALYDYSDYYGNELVEYQVNNPNGYAQELARAWEYYKTAFILNNGLVNHSQWNPGAGSVVGTNEAVSEGQGYGMLLAVLMNDQQTFNRIYEASTQYMWDNNRNSYFVWNWPSGGQGSATDADLDIGLALVFADELQKKGLWQSYSGPVGYSVRAMEIIRSIKNNMTQNDYLLPGDNWGGDALNNLNPSYFAVAWLKIFNSWQDEVDFTAVINKCYQVLALMPHYNKGQAADWITTSGGRGSRGDRGMDNDAIRTPYRIAMDALWFNDSRAIQYCANSKNTLTGYTVSPINLLGQMGLYTESGSLISGTAGGFHYVAMWASGILGSKDESFTKASLQGRVISQITGTTKNYFGDESLHDHQYYYNQSLAMLGFAVITGQFPNIYADMQGEVNTGIPLLTPLNSSANTAYFPQTITFTATIESAAAWTLTLTGQSSGIKKEFSGNGADISVPWDGEGFTVVEVVTAQLTVAGLESQADPNVLKYNVQVMGPHVGVKAMSGALDLHWKLTHEGLELTASEGASQIHSVEIFNTQGKSMGVLKPRRKISGGWLVPLVGFSHRGILWGRVKIKSSSGYHYQFNLNPLVLIP